MVTTAGSARREEETKAFEEANARLVESHKHDGVHTKPRMVANQKKIAILRKFGNLESNIPINSEYWQLPELVEVE